jgi:hypothetical protein
LLKMVKVTRLEPVRYKTHAPQMLGMVIMHVKLVTRVI